MIISEISVTVHVIDVTPLHIQRQIVGFKSCNYFSQLVSVIVSPSALMPSKSPLGDHNRFTNKFKIS